MNVPRIPVAVVGTGSAGMQHLHALRQIEGVQPIAVPHRPDRLMELEQQGYATAADLKDAVHKRGATLCIIASDTGRHLEDALSAVHNGLDVLVEKPMGADAQEARRQCLEATRAGRRIFVGCVLRFSESLTTFRTLMDQIGKPHAVRVECQSYLPDWRPVRAYQDSYSARKDEGGVLRDLIHEIDYAGWLFGWPLALQAQVRNLGRLGISADEAADVMWETEERCAVTVRLDYLSQPARRRMSAFGQWGTLEWEGIANTVTLALSGQPARTIVSRQTRQDMLVAQVRAFICAAHGVEAGTLATGLDGWRALAVCDAAKRASANRRTERVEY